MENNISNIGKNDDYEVKVVYSIVLVKVEHHDNVSTIYVDKVTLEEGSYNLVLIEVII